MVLLADILKYKELKIEKWSMKMVQPEGQYHSLNSFKSPNLESHVQQQTYTNSHTHTTPKAPTNTFTHPTQKHWKLKLQEIYTKGTKVEKVDFGIFGKFQLIVLTN